MALVDQSDAALAAKLQQMTLTDRVREYWEQETCGVVHAHSEPGTPRFFAEIEEHRYRAEPYIRPFAQFAQWGDRRVLEIGIGAGTDLVNFARSGAILAGVDLTSAAIDYARQRLALENLEADLRVANAEQLPFPEHSFDLVYSFGVIHHAEHPEQVVREVRRVLAPGGEARIMLYGLHSWVAYRLLALEPARAIRQRRSPRMRLREVVADNMESPNTQAYTRREVEIMFAAAGFERVQVDSAVTPYDHRAVGRLAKVMRRDWNLLIVAR